MTLSAPHSGQKAQLLCGPCATQARDAGCACWAHKFCLYIVLSGHYKQCCCSQSGPFFETRVFLQSCKWFAGTAAVGPAVASMLWRLLLLLQGPSAEGGLIFVLKSGNTGQNTKWLKVGCWVQLDINCTCYCYIFFEAHSRVNPLGIINLANCSI
eukprot:GHRR01029983.1.p1 GENE.GHRR01029983.1~~GHRR01029983.1.p1  ORF type:complete len:155 (+),score=31.32 GHRR01029983.1:364-828(+)